MSRRIRAAAAAAVLGVVATAGLAQPAAAGTHDLHVKNVGSKRFVVADHFEWPRDASSVQSTCGRSLTTHRSFLEPGRSSTGLYVPSLAKDVDCIEVPKGWSLKRDKVGPNSTYVKCSVTRDRAVAKKVSPPPWSKRFYLKRCG